MLRLKNVSVVQIFLLLTCLRLTESSESLHLSILYDDFRHLRHEHAISHVINDSVPTYPWHSCHSNDPALPPSSNCYIHPSSSSRIFFFYSLSPARDAIPPQHHPRVLTSSYPPISDFFYRPLNSRGAFSISLPCVHANFTLETVSFTLSFLSHKIAFSHRCPQGPLPSLQFSAKHSGLSSSITLSVSHPFAATDISSIKAVSHEPQILHVRLDDESDVGFLTPLSPRHLSLFYTCSTFHSRSVLVTLTITLAPFNDVIRSWKVQCGGKKGPPGLFVSSEPWLGNIVADGKNKFPYGEGFEIRGGQLELFVSYLDWRSGKHLEYSKPSVVGGLAGSIKPKGSGIIRKGTQVKWVIKARCKGIGRGIIEVNVGFWGGHELKMTFWRNCGVTDLVRSLWFGSILGLGLGGLWLSARMSRKVRNRAKRRRPVRV